MGATEMSSQQPHGPTDNPHVVHEESDINVRAIIWFVIVLTAISLAINVAMWGLFKGLEYYEEKHDPIVSPLAAAPAPATGGPQPGPGLQLTPWTDLKQFNAEQAAQLNGYGWVDEHGGIARVPIDKAKQLLLKQGLPVRPELADALEGTSLASGGESNGGRTIPAGQADKSSPVAAPAPAASTPPGAPPAAPVVPTKPGGGL
jgi:hypothetical protein